MLFINRLLLVGLLGVGITAATTAQAGSQLFTAEWFTKSFGNELVNGTGQSAIYSAFAIPHGLFCNDLNPRCPFDSTPTNGATKSEDRAFAPLGGTKEQGAPPFFCAPWTSGIFDNEGATARPAKGDTLFVITPAGGRGTPIPPQYRNPLFFTSAGEPLRTACAATSTGVFSNDLTRYGAAKGLVQVGHPVTGSWGAFTNILGTVTTTNQNPPVQGGFKFPAAPGNPARGVRTTGLLGDFPALYPYLYSYTYATLKNDFGSFGPGSGPGSFNVKYSAGANPVATINVKQGAAKFGGVMRMLGAYTTKVCYFRVGGCSIGRMNWRYDAVGATAYTSGGVVYKGYQALFTTIYYNTALMQQSTINVVGSRFPWTTGSVTLKATGRGPRKTVHYAHGYDNRTTTMQGTVTNVKGTIQLVSPIITRWLVSAAGFDFETGGIGILRIKFVPEPQTWALLIAGISLLGVGYRMRGR